jgi:branched-chain amino acid transport system substrate-binding protein
MNERGNSELTHRNRFVVLAAALIAVVTLSLTACSSASGTSANKSDVIKIGYLASLSGDSAVWGIAETSGAEMAVNEINAAGGVNGRQLQLLKEDGKGDPTDSVNAARKLISDGALIIMGANVSGINLATAPVVAAAKVPQIGTYTSNPAVTVDEKGNVRPYSFRLGFIDPYQGQVIADFLYKQLGIKTAGVLYNQGDDYSSGVTKYFRDRFVELGGTVTDEESYRTGDLDFRAQLSKIQATSPEALVLPDLYKEIALAANQAQELGFKPTIIGSDGWSDKMLELAPTALEGSYWVTQVSAEDPAVKDVITRYQQTYKDTNQTPSVVAAYDLVYWVADALKRSNGQGGEALKTALEQTNNLQLKHATLTIDPATHNPVNKPAVMLKVENGTMKFVARFSAGD